MFPFLASSAFASTVCPIGCDHDSVTAALDAAVAGEVVEITAPGDYAAFDLRFPTNTTVRGVTEGITLVDAEIVGLADGMRFENVTIDCGGRALSGLSATQISLTLSWSEVRNCHAVSGSLATVSHQNASLVIENSYLHDLSADVDGGVVDMLGGTVEIRHSLICDTTAGVRGGVVHRDAQARELILDHAIIVNSTAAQGGVLFNDNVGDVSIEGNTFLGNQATSPTGGGVLYLQRRGVTVRDNLFAFTASGDAIAPEPPIANAYNYNGFWANLSEDVTAGGSRGGSAYTSDPELPAPGCDPALAMVSEEPYDQGASDGGPVGAFGGDHPDPTAWDDEDGDGRVALFDCDDTDPTINDLLPETQCDGIDNDCDGLIDDGFLSEGYADADADGVGTGPLLTGCPGILLASIDGDCDDTDPTVGPGVPEVTCNGVDDDCDAATPDSVDADGDLDPDCTDCDDADPLNSSTGTEVCDGQDNDCDDVIDAGPGIVRYADLDGDGYGDPGRTYSDCALGVETGDDCDDADDAVNPDATEQCDPDDRDEDCDGLADDEDPDAEGTLPVPVDGDGDGFADPVETETRCEPVDLEATDCDDADDAVYPGATEVPDDGVDQDCDGEDAPFTYGNGSCGCQSTEGFPVSGVLLALVIARVRRGRRQTG